MRLEHLKKPFILGRVFLQTFQFVAAGAESTCGRCQQPVNGGGAFLAGIDQVLLQRANDAVAASVDLADL